MRRCFSLHRGCMRDDNSRRVVGVLAWCIAHVQHTRVNTNVGSMYFFQFSIYIKSMYIMFSKVICCTKKHCWSLTSSWPDEVQRVFSTAYDFFFKSLVLIPQTVFKKWLHMWLILHFAYCVLCIIFDDNLSSSSTQL